MKKVLIPTDFSEISKNAMRYAMDLFNTMPCHFYLLYVNIEGLDYKPKPIYKFGTNILVEKGSRSFDQRLNDFVAYAKTNSPNKEIHQFTSVHEKGYFLKSIRKYIQREKIELIVMGTGGASQLKEFLMGSNAGDVITKVGCDILVIPNSATYDGYEEVVFPIDFALSYSDDILIGLSNVVISKTARIRVLHVTKSDDGLTDEEQSRKENLLIRLGESLPNPISFHKIQQRNVENAILRFAQSVMADLIVMVSKDYNFLQKQFLDTTVEEVSFDTRIPLLSIQG